MNTDAEQLPPPEYVCRSCSFVVIPDQEASSLTINCPKCDGIMDMVEA